jgi:hypothetical protein
MVRMAEQRLNPASRNLMLNGEAIRLEGSLVMHGAD